MTDQHLQYVFKHALKRPDPAFWFNESCSTGNRRSNITI